jgi:hypothetical protein
MKTSKLIEIFQSFKSKSLGCSMPAWKQGHAQIFYLSPNNAHRKKIKVMGASSGQSLALVYA